jgi:FkbM family methyltransferase
MNELSQTPRRKLLLHNLLFGGLTGRVTVTKDDGHFVVTAGSEKIYLVNPDRWRRYRWGIPRQLRRLAFTYGASNYASEFAGRVVLDIGANIGEFSLYARSKGAEVIAIEPDRVNLEILKKNLAGKGIRIVEKALWKETATLTFYSAPGQADSALLPATAYDSAYEIEAVRLDDVTSELGLDEIFFIKGDAEGAEPEVLTGARSTLARTRFIAFDCGPERAGADTVDWSSKILEEAGFDVRLLDRRRTIVFGSNKRYARA